MATEEPEAGRVGPRSDHVAMPLTEGFDHAVCRVEVVGQMRESHPGTELSRQSGQFLVGRVKSRMTRRRRLMDDQVGGSKPVDQGRVVGRIGAEAEGPAAGMDAEGRGRDAVNRCAGTRSKTDRR